MARFEPDVIKSNRNRRIRANQMKEISGPIVNAQMGDEYDSQIPNIEAQTGDDRLDYNALKNKPTLTKGDQGVQGRYNVEVYRSVLGTGAGVTIPNRPTATSYNPANQTTPFTGLTPGWLTTPPVYNALTHTLIISRFRYDPANPNLSVVFDQPNPSSTRGETGAAGNDGWTPVFALVNDGQRRVWQLVDYSNGTGTKPTANINEYVTPTGYSSDINDGTDTRGGFGTNPRGDYNNGTSYNTRDVVYHRGTRTAYFARQTHVASSTTEPGVGADWETNWQIFSPPGDRGWTMVFADEVDGIRIIRKLVDYVGGEGNKPSSFINQYTAETTTGFTTDKSMATNYRSAPLVNTGAWEEDEDYELNTIVIVNRLAYLIKEAHHSDQTNKPPNARYWDQIINTGVHAGRIQCATSITNGAINITLPSGFTMEQISQVDIAFTILLRNAIGDSNWRIESSIPIARYFGNILTGRGYIPVESGGPNHVWLWCNTDIGNTTTTITIQIYTASIGSSTPVLNTDALQNVLGAVAIPFGGAAGSNGKSILNGAVNPQSSVGTDGDFYINTTTFQIFGPKTNGVWGNPFTLSGGGGGIGNQGPQGRYDVKVFRLVSHNPGGTTSTRPNTPTASSWDPVSSSFTGLTSGWVLTPPVYDPATQDVYESFASYDPSSSSLGSFSTPFEIGAEIGPAGPAGATGSPGRDGLDSTVPGPKGDKGDPGIPGTTTFNGLTDVPDLDPSNTTDFLRRDGTFATPPGGSGGTGPAGMNGLSVLNGERDPINTDGRNGEFWINTATNTIFGPKTAGVWGNGTPLVGPAGSAGQRGLQGVQGRYDIKVFQSVAHNPGGTSSTRPATPSATAWNPSTNTFTGLTPGWLLIPPTFDPATHDVWESFVTFEPASNSLSAFSTPFEIGAEIGPAGMTGPTGAPGADSTVPGPKGDKGDKGDPGSPGATTFDALTDVQDLDTNNTTQYLRRDGIFAVPPGGGGGGGTGATGGTQRDVLATYTIASTFRIHDTGYTIPTTATHPDNELAFFQIQSTADTARPEYRVGRTTWGDIRALTAVDRATAGNANDNRVSSVNFTFHLIATGGVETVDIFFFKLNNDNLGFGYSNSLIRPAILTVYRELAPAGEKGDKGDAGSPGDPGTPGATTFDALTDVPDLDTNNTTNFLRQDGTFAEPPGAGGGPGVKASWIGGDPRTTLSVPPATISFARTTTGSGDSMVSTFTPFTSGLPTDVTITSEGYLQDSRSGTNFMGVNWSQEGIDFTQIRARTVYRDGGGGTQAYFSLGSSTMFRNGTGEDSARRLSDVSQGLVIGVWGGSSENGNKSLWLINEKNNTSLNRLGQWSTNATSAQLDELITGADSQASRHNGDVSLASAFDYQGVNSFDVLINKRHLMIFLNRQKIVDVELPDLDYDVGGSNFGLIVRKGSSSTQIRSIAIEDPTMNTLLELDDAEIDDRIDPAARAFFASGTFHADRIPNLDASKINTGQLDQARIPSIDATKIGTGTLANARISNNIARTTQIIPQTGKATNEIYVSTGTGIADGDWRTLVSGDIPNLNASKINAGTFSSARIPNLSATKITSGTFNTARIPNLDANKITSGTLPAERVLGTLSIFSQGTSYSANRFVIYENNLYTALQTTTQTPNPRGSFSGLETTTEGYGQNTGIANERYSLTDGSVLTGNIPSSGGGFSVTNRWLPQIIPDFSTSMIITIGRTATNIGYAYGIVFFRNENGTRFISSEYFDINSDGNNPATFTRTITIPNNARSIGIHTERNSNRDLWVQSVGFNRSFTSEWTLVLRGASA